MKKMISILAVLMLTATCALAGEAQLPELPEGVVPVTWEPSPEHLLIETEEARELYDRISAGDYPPLEEMIEHPVVKQLDALDAYYIALYGDTSQISTPEREELRENILKEFLARGSARSYIKDDHSILYHYDGELKKDFQCELVLGLPASGKSTMVADPDSEKLGAFILDSDMIKEMIPEFQESYGAAADAVHPESKIILEKVIEAFTQGEMKGVNVVIPIIGSDEDSLRRKYITPFEEAGYNVKIVCIDATMDQAFPRVIRRALKTGRIINSSKVLEYGDKPMQVYNSLKDQINAWGEPYGMQDESEENEEAEKPAA